MNHELVVYEDDLFLIQPCLGTPLPGYLVLEVKGENQSLADLDQETSTRLGMLLSRAVGAIEAVLKPERVYCLSFGEVKPEVHFHLFPRTLGLLEAYWKATGTQAEQVDGPALFKWARACPGEGGSPEAIAAVSQQIRRELLTGACLAG